MITIYNLSITILKKITNIDIILKIYYKFFEHYFERKK